MNYERKSEVGVRELRDRLSEYLRQVENGGEVVITRHGRRIACLTGFDPERPLEDLVRRGLVRMPERQRSPRRARVQALDASPANVLRAMRGPIVNAQKAYPDVLHLEIRDPAGEMWRLATQDAKWSPSDPTDLVGNSIEDAKIDEKTGELRCMLSDGSVLDVRPAIQEAGDDPPNWELITPGGVLLEFGPGVRWQISSANAPASSRR